MQECFKICIIDYWSQCETVIIIKNIINQKIEKTLVASNLKKAFFLFMEFNLSKSLTGFKLFASIFMNVKISGSLDQFCQESRDSKMGNFLGSLFRNCRSSPSNREHLKDFSRKVRQIQLILIQNRQQTLSSW